WCTPLTHEPYCALGECRGLLGDRAIPLEHGEPGERAQIGGNVAAWSLHFSRHRDAEAVVLDIEEHRQAQRGGDGEGGPEPIGRHRSVATENDRDAAIVACIPQHFAAIADGLSPTCGGCVLRSDTAARRQHRGASLCRQVEYNTNVAPVAAGPEI